MILIPIHGPLTDKLIVRDKSLGNDLVERNTRTSESANGRIRRIFFINEVLERNTLERDGLVNMDTRLLFLTFTEGSHHVTDLRKFAGSSTFTTDGERAGRAVQETFHKASSHFTTEGNDIQGLLGCIHFGKELRSFLCKFVQIAEVTGTLTTQHNTIGTHFLDFKFKITAASRVVVGRRRSIVMQDGIVRIERQHSAVVSREFVGGFLGHRGVFLAICGYRLCAELQAKIARSIGGSRIVGKDPTEFVIGIGEDSTDTFQIVLHTLGGRHFEHIGLLLETGSERQHNNCCEQNGFIQLHIHFLHC